MSSSSIGKRYGKLTIEAVSGTFADCICDCGNRKTIRLSSVVSGNTKSCGCLRVKDLTGQTFGKLKVKSLAYTKNRFAYWSCVCECGTSAVVRGVSLTNGNTKSCGCGAKNHADKMLSDRVKETRIGSLSRKPQRNNTSGHTGVYWYKKKQKWHAEIIFQKVRYYLGYFDNFDDAVKTREAAEDATHNDFLRWYATSHPEKAEAVQKKLISKTNNPSEN